ncbi:MAG TPA: gluconate 2-dehydrogenase subunit 3 family protein, partial [Gemmatimonadaceae bacterium]
AAAPLFFTAHEWRTVRMLVDYIIPRDDRSGSATEARVPEFMDFIMRDKPDMQIWMRGGLAWLDLGCERRFGATFVAATLPQRSEMLDAIAYPAKAASAMRPGVAFFNRFRDLTASGFYTTRMGIDDVQYMGNRMRTGWDGCPDAALRKLGVSYKDVYGS